MKDSLKKTLDSINKKNPNTIGTIKTMKRLDVKRIPTGSHYLDYATGGGWPRGRIIELYGHPSSGKSTIAAKTIAEAQKLGLDCVYLDCENAFDPEFATKLGIDIENLIISQASESEATFDQIFALCDGGADVIVVDSVASMVPKQEFDNEMAQPNIALGARAMSKGLRILLPHQQKHHTLVIFINQIRMSPGAYGNPETTTGGKALGFYSSVRVEVRKGDWIEDNKQKIGQVIKFKVTKNKTAPPYQQGTFNFMYDGYIDRIDELISLGIETGNITRRGAYYDTAGQSFQGRDNLYKAFKSNKELAEKFAKVVIP